MKEKTEKRKKVIYICGPYRSGNGEWFVKKHIREAERIAELVWVAGGVALCPHKNTQWFGGLVPDEVFLEGDLELLRRCDAVLTVPGWEGSKGAFAEVEFAQNHNIPVFYHPHASYQLPKDFEDFING